MSLTAQLEKCATRFARRHLPIKKNHQKKQQKKVKSHDLYFCSALWSVVAFLKKKYKTKFGLAWFGYPPTIQNLLQLDHPKYHWGKINDLIISLKVFLSPVKTFPLVRLAWGCWNSATRMTASIWRTLHRDFIGTPETPAASNTCCSSVAFFNRCSLNTLHFPDKNIPSYDVIGKKKNLILAHII